MSLNNVEHPMKSLLVVALLAPPVCWATSYPIECPQTLDVKSTATPPAGWQVVNSGSANTLDRIGFYSGPPAERASLVPDKSQNKMGESKDIWTFSPNAAETIWAECVYTGTTLTIAKPMEHGVTTCEVRYKTTRAGSRLSVIKAQCE